MPTIDYAAKAKSAAKLLEKFGGPITLRQIIPGEYNPSTNQMTEETIIDKLAVGVVLNYEQDVIDGTRIQSDDREIYLGADGLDTPTTTDKVVIGSSVFSILNVQAIQPYDVPVLYLLQARR